MIYILFHYFSLLRGSLQIPNNFCFLDGALPLLTLNESLMKKGFVSPLLFKQYIEKEISGFILGKGRRAC